MYDDLGPDLEGFDLMDEEDLYDLGEQEDYMKSQTVYDVFRYCLKPTVLDAYANLLHLFLVCLLFRTATQIARFSSTFYHLASAVSGSYVLYVFFSGHCLHTIGMVLVCYLALKKVSSSFGRYRGYCIAAGLLTYLFLAEMSLVKSQTWERIRGPQMMTAIKIISYAFDLDNGCVKKLNFLNYLGYALCPGTSIFGPWVSYSDYLACLDNDQWDLKWIYRIFMSFLKSLIFFTLSVCILEWVVPDNSTQPWLIYRNAMSFRVSHYFVSYVSETSALFSGYVKRIDVSKPMSIEIPHSLVEVVVYWNLPLHRWLKTYVFKTTLQAGSLVAVMSTYLISALLHGLNLRLAAVLLSLGVYTYVEHSFRSDLAYRFSACVSSRSCSAPCHKHRNTTNNLIVHTVNNLFTALAMFHLAYLGVLIDMTNSKQVTLENAFLEWHNVNYISHIVVLATFIIHKIMMIFM
ncbi:protein-serine O-palmitoleoyltransferase porcupine [Cimex lectularius]|uniref:Protein-serine O-palmitoleoyltransferase porcupine n=1 Tax=Cimex lectularius TaxID=79782 RepID=A0A8I6TJP5_CIMLE|nr:protein-serine O-palmitoleoyltransferase porcupine [Cimex lectularius]